VAICVAFAAAYVEAAAFDAVTLLEVLD